MSLRYSALLLAFEHRRKDWTRAANTKSPSLSNEYAMWQIVMHGIPPVVLMVRGIGYYRPFFSAVSTGSRRGEKDSARQALQCSEDLHRKIAKRLASLAGDSFRSA